MHFLSELPRWRRFLAIRIRNRRELIAYVVGTTAMCAAGALALDVANQLLFFVDWPTAFRSWSITVGIGSVIAMPVSYAIGKAHLALYVAGRTDPLTGLLNRRALLEGVENRLTFIALAMVDVDRFKHVNDTHGHLVGDEVLTAVANMMKLTLGRFGQIGRVGGEEFALLASVDDRELLFQALTNFRELLAATPVVAGSTSVTVTISAGIAMYREGQTFKQLYAEADHALYCAKALGRNRVVWAEDVIGDRAAASRLAETEPVRAVQRLTGAAG